MKLKKSEVEWTRTYEHKQRGIECKISKLKGSALYLVDYNGQDCIYGGNFEKKLLDDKNWRLKLR